MTVSLSLYHKKQPDFRSKVDQVNLCDFNLVLMWAPPTTEIPAALEELFELTQNLDEPWNASKPCRSTSVGDVVCVSQPGQASEYYLVDGIGFSKINAILQ